MASSVLRNHLRCLQNPLKQISRSWLVSESANCSYVKRYIATLPNTSNHVLHTAKMFQKHFIICKTSNGLLSKSIAMNSFNPLINCQRHITSVSRLGKRKSSKSVLKRFRRVKGGFLKRWRSGMVHKQIKKSSWRKFRLRGSILVKRPSHLKTLNKMMYKH